MCPAPVGSGVPGGTPLTPAHFWAELASVLEEAPPDFLKDTQFTTIGVSESSFVFVKVAAKKTAFAFECLEGLRLAAAGSI